jgi:hypothetical protein
VTVHLIPFGVMALGVVLLLIFASAWMTANPEDVPVDDDEVER